MSLLKLPTITLKRNDETITRNLQLTFPFNSLIVIKKSDNSFTKIALKEQSEEIISFTLGDKWIDEKNSQTYVVERIVNYFIRLKKLNN